MEKYTVFTLTAFFTGILQFSDENKIVRNLEETELPAHEWKCNDYCHENDILTAKYIAALEIGPGNGATFVHQPEPGDFKNYLHIQRNF